MDIKKIEGGFILNNIKYIIDGEIEIISETQCHVPANENIILLDLSVSIDNEFFENINTFKEKLKTK